MTDKSKKTLCNVLIGVLGFLVLFVLGVRIAFRAPVHSYYKISKKAFLIPGCNKGFIAQGISYDADDDIFYITGYMKDGSASPIYLVNKTTKKCVQTVYMTEPDGTAYNGHSGGLSVYGDTVYVAGSKKCNLLGFDKAAIKAAPKGSSIAYTSEIAMEDGTNGIGAAFTTTRDGILYSGEFYRDGPYPTLDSHIIKTCDGENHALMVGFEPDGDDFVPTVLYSIPANVQGVCFQDGKLYVSTSWGPSSSNIYVYDEAEIKAEGTYEYLGYDLPLYIVDSSSLVKTYKIAPMSEEIECVDGEYYVMCESASNKYIFGKFTGAFWCYKSAF